MFAHKSQQEGIMGEEEEAAAPPAEETPAEETPAPEGEAAAEGEEGAAPPAEEGGEAAAEEEAPPPPKELKKIVKEVTDDEVKAAVGEADAKVWEQTSKQAAEGGKTVFDKLRKDVMNHLLDSAVPVDVMALGMTCRDMYTKYGKPRQRKEQMRWNKVKAVYEWERGMGGPLWDFPEGSTSSLEAPAEDVVKKEFVEQSKSGKIELKHDVSLAATKGVHKATYEAIVRRSLGARLLARDLKEFEINLGDYQEEGNSTFSVSHQVFGGEKKEMHDKMTVAIKTHVEVRALSHELKNVRNIVASATANSSEIQDRAGALKEAWPELAEVDASAPIMALRDAVKGPQELIRETMKKMDNATTDALFAERMGGGKGEGVQVDYRFNVAKRLRTWLEAQAGNIDKEVVSVNKELLDKSMGDDACKTTTSDLTVKGLDTAPAPEFLETEDAIAVMDMLFKTATESSLGDSLTISNEPKDDKVAWTVEMEV